MNLSNKACAMIDFTLASVDLAIATSGTSVAPWALYGLAALLFCTGLTNLVEYLKEDKDGWWDLYG